MNKCVNFLLIGFRSHVAITVLMTITFGAVRSSKNRELFLRYSSINSHVLSPHLKFKRQKPCPQWRFEESFLSRRHFRRRRIHQGQVAEIETTLLKCYVPVPSFIGGRE
ncbi:unnamed protein product [Ixodes pacificus]